MPITPLVQERIDAWNDAALAVHSTPEGATIKEIDMGGRRGRTSSTRGRR
jgi:hypothetical protein